MTSRIMEKTNCIIEFIGWERVYGTFRMNSVILPDGKPIEKLLFIHEGDWIHSDAMSFYQEYILYEDVQRYLGRGLVFKGKEYSVLFKRSLFLYDIDRSSKNTEIKICVPATGEEIDFEIYGLDYDGGTHLLIKIEL